MSYLKLKSMKKLNFSIIIFFLYSFFSFSIYSKDFIIEGNNYSDDDIIKSIISDLPQSDDKTIINYILKELLNSNLFKNVEVSSDDNFYYINVIEHPSVKNIFLENNERLKDEEIESIIDDLNIENLSEKKIDLLITEISKIYKSFGYNNIEINKNIILYENNSGDLYLNFNEGKITKIKNINIFGNSNFEKNVLLSKIKSKTKKLSNIFANNNFKLFQIQNDTIRLIKFYKSNGYRDVSVEFDIEYFDNNKVDVNFKIIEGDMYYLSSIDYRNNLSYGNIDQKLNLALNQETKIIDTFYNEEKIDNLEFLLSDIIEQSEVQFFEIKTFEKVEDNNVKILFEINSTEPTYLNRINISGNTRTFDYVIRRELEIVEGDPINDSKIKQINKKLSRLSIFKDINVNKKNIKEDEIDLEIDVEETQTGSFNIGLSVGTLDGASFLSGLKERNINGTGRSVEFLINTNENNQAFTLSTTEKFILNNKINHKYSTNYKEEDFSVSKSYKLNKFELDNSFSYILANDLIHSFGLGYQLKEYIITNSSTVSSNILSSSGDSISFNIHNDLTFNTLNSYLKPTSGNFFKFSNLIQTPSSSTNGYLKNLITLKKYNKLQNNILSVQAKIGNIYSLNDNEILSDDKFSLGGRWLRGFDNFGAGPRNSRTAYVGGNNLLATKFDFSRPLTLNDQNPIYLNLFNDYGLVWENKNSVTNSDESLRASYGFGFNYFSPIGPIGFSWGFPLLDKEYDIKRMFMFTIGNLN